MQDKVLCFPTADESRRCSCRFSLSSWCRSSCCGTPKHQIFLADTDKPWALPAAASEHTAKGTLCLALCFLQQRL